MKKIYLLAKIILIYLFLISDVVAKQQDYLNIAAKLLPGWCLAPIKWRGCTFQRCSKNAQNNALQNALFLDQLCK